MASLLATFCGLYSAPMNAYTLRQAQPTLEDARLLYAAEHASLGDSRYSPEEMLTVMERAEHHIYLALHGDATAGFCACIDTQQPEGVQLEIDMLGVLPEHRSRGLATALIQRALAEASARDVTRRRAVVAADNLPSRRAFMRTGLSVVGRAQMLVYELHGWQPVAFLPEDWRWDVAPVPVVSTLAVPAQIHRLFTEDGSLAATATCVAVHTLAYTGIWIESLWAAEASAYRLIARAVVEHAKVLDLDEVGHLAPVGAADVERALRHEGFSAKGDYDILAG